uniref:Uncharacterized protein n=1 Tax=Pygocentrus nattereri TaxID=42514 RepID=A0AAR2L8Q3_PYGNA
MSLMYLPYDRGGLSVVKKKGTLFHCLWQCAYIRRYWEAVRDGIQNILCIQIPLDPKLFLLGIYPMNYKIRKRHQQFLEIGILLAKRVIAVSWKRTGVPGMDKW